ncbi:MAG: MucB/RseB C-terminal domain-containing protein [Pseudomarimonas sp.]
MLVPSLAHGQAAEPVATNAPGVAVDAAASPAAWLRRMNFALATADFDGTLVYLRDGQLDALRIEQHPGSADGVRLTSLSGENVEVAGESETVRLTVSDGVSRWPSAPASQVAMLPVRKPPAAHYELALVGSDRVAGRQAQVLEIRPRDGFRYGYRLWIDASSALLLKSLTIGSDGRAVEQVMFTELSTSFSTVAQTTEVTGIDSEQASLPTSMAATGVHWQVLDAPAGFLPTLVVDGEKTHLLFSDGVARVSVYIDPLSTQQATMSGLLSRGALNSFGRVAHGRQIIVMGDAPAATVERFAQGVVPREADGRSPSP